MPLKLSDTIMGYRSGFDYETILARLDGADAKDRSFATRLQFWCIVAGIDSAISFAQWLLETDNAQSPRWNDDLNASGMGIVADATAQPFYIPDVDAAARLFVQCLYSLVNRKRHPEINLWVSTQTKRGGEEWFTDVWLPKVQSTAMPDVRTVADLGLRYTENGDSRATWSWEDGKVPQDTYGKKLVSRIAEFYPGLPDQDPPVTTPSTPAEPVEEEPPMVNPEILKPEFISAYATKRSDGQGFNYGTRGPIVGIVEHERQGRIGTAKAGQEFFSCVTDDSCAKYGICSDGERCQNALVDWEILRSGQLVQYQDPYDTNRIPWASGGAEQNGNAIGKAINAKYRGVFGGVNKVFAAVEMEKTDDEPLTAAQIQTGGKLMAYVMAKAGYPANDWEYPDILGGNIYTAPHHSDISQTSCRLSDADKAAIKKVCQKELDAFYAGITPGDTPTTPAEPTPTDIIPGVDLAIAKRLFGIAKGEDGKNYSYDPTGPVSKLWTERGKQSRQWPKLTEVWSYGDGRRYFLFADGSVIFDPAGSDPPKWLMQEAAA